MTKQKKIRKTSVEAFLKDLKGLDRKLLASFAFVLLILLFVSQTSAFDIEKGTVFGIQTTFLEKPTINSSPMEVPKPALYPKKDSDVPTPFITAQSAIVIDVASQVVLYTKSQDAQFPPASTTKIMTALVALEQFALDDVLTVPALSIEGAKMKLVPGEQITFENLLYGLLLASGNDAAETIAYNFPGGKDASILTMNKTAKELNLVNTHFQNTTGLESENHYTTALDLARLASFALKNETFARIVSSRYKTVSDITGAHVHSLENLNKLLGSVEGVTGIKTGFTEEAGQVLVAAAARDGHTIVTVVLKSNDRFLDSKNLLEWAFANHVFIADTAY